MSASVWVLVVFVVVFSSERFMVGRNQFVAFPVTLSFFAYASSFRGVFFIQAARIEFRHLPPALPIK